MKFIYLILFLFLISCSSTSNLNPKKIQGEYILDDNFYGIGSSIKIKGNNSFEYEWVTGLINGITKGKYVINNNKIILNSEFQPESEEFQNKYRILESENKNLDSIKIRVLEKNGITLNYATCILINGDSLIYVTESDNYGFAKIPKVDADSLGISFIGYDYASIPLNNLKSDYLAIELNEKNPDFEYYQFFTNKNFKIRNNKLIGDKEKFIKKK
ncbi:MAG: hypothetical protein COA67_06655 [Lutibacter sp.]|nr:MAG: hypothetical protein COA67_06655 [Lutibacter sp.]